MTDTGEWTTRRYLSLLGNVLIWAIVAIDAWYLWPVQLGGSTSMVIVSGVSMEPSYFSGDLVIARKVEPSIGDVIVYAPEGYGGGQIVHRIIGGNGTDGWQMQGDNNDFIDPFTPKASEVKGVVLVHYANFGRVTALLLNPVVWAAILLLAIVLLVWWSGDSCEDDSDDDPTEDDARDDAGVGDGGDRPEGDAAAVDEDVLEPAVAQAAAAKPGVVRGVAAIAAGLLAVAMTVSPASASQLHVTVAGSVASMDYERCAPLTLDAAATGAHNGNQYTHVTVTGVSSACVGLPISITMHKSNGDIITAGASTVLGGAQTLTVASFNAQQVSTAVVKINGWVYLATSTPPQNYTCDPADNDPTPVDTDPCSVSPAPGATWSEWGSPGSRFMNIYLDVTTAANTPNAIVTLDLSQAPFPAWTVGSIMGNKDWIPVPGYSCSELPIVRLYANPQHAGVGQMIYFQLAESTTAFGTGPIPTWSSRICPGS